MALPLLTAAGIGALLGGVKHYAFDKPGEEADRKLAAETARYSPWTGMRPGQVKRANLGGTLIQGGATGALLGQQLGGAETITPVEGSVQQGPFSWGLLGRATGANNWEDLNY